MDDIKYIKDLLKNDSYLKDKAIEVKQEGGKYIITRWGDPPTQELADENIPDDKISKKSLEALERVVKARPNLINKLLNR